MMIRRLRDAWRVTGSGHCDHDGLHVRTLFDLPVARLFHRNKRFQSMANCHYPSPLHQPMPYALK